MTDGLAVPAESRPQRVICVLGMHRSGTSCLAGSLEQWAAIKSAASDALRRRDDVETAARRGRLLDEIVVPVVRDLDVTREVGEGGVHGPIRRRGRR
jgi:hypothetical protein